MQALLIFIIRLYQKTLSRDHGFFRGRYPYGYCPFYPTCSEYAKLAIERYGSIQGVWMATKRIVRCRPGTLPAVDKVPQI